MVLHLIGRKTNHQASILTLDSTKTKNKRITQGSIFGFLLLFVLFNLGVLSNSTWHVPVTEASHANLSRVVDCFTGEIRHSRETGPPEQAQREVRRPLPQSRQSAAPQKITRPSQTQFFIPLCLANHRSTDQVVQKFDRCILVAAACVGLGGYASHPRRPKSDSLFGGVGRNNRPPTAAHKGGRGPSLVSLVALGCILALVGYSFFFQLRYSSIGPKGIFFHEILLRAFLTTHIWQILREFMEIWTCQTSKKLAKVFFGYFRFASVASLWKVLHDTRYLLFYLLFCPNNVKRKVVQIRPPHDAPR